MKSFVLTIPKSLLQIEDHYFCECGNQFKDQKKCHKCGNRVFFTYEDVKNYNSKLYEIRKTKNGIEIFIEYPVVSKTIKPKKERIAILIDNEIKLNQTFRENMALYYNEICVVVKIYLKFLGLWKERKRYFYLLKKFEDERILFLTQVKDVEVLLWNTFSLTHTKEKFFNNLLKNSPKSVKKAVYEKYRKQVFNLKYQPLLDYLIIKAIDDINLQKELLKYFENKNVFINSNIDPLIEILKHFDKKKVVKFLKKNIHLIDLYAEASIKKEITEFKKDIEETFKMSRFKKIVYEYDIKILYTYEHLTFKLPIDSYELIEWGNKLKNCLANYTSLHNKRYLIFGIFKENKLTYAVNFDKEKKYIVEAKGFANSLVPVNDMNKINQFFKEML